jgi:hypothetical protein
MSSIEAYWAAKGRTLNGPRLFDTGVASILFGVFDLDRSGRPPKGFCTAFSPNGDLSLMETSRSLNADPDLRAISEQANRCGSNASSTSAKGDHSLWFDRTKDFQSPR